MTDSSLPEPKSTKSDTPDRDRRCHYRVDDQLHFDFKLVERKTMRYHPASELFTQQREQQLLAELSKLDDEGQNLLRDIAKEHRGVAIYLGLLNRKTQLISQHLCQSQSAQHMVKLNLSEGGLAFNHDTALNVGDYMAVSLGISEEAWQLFLYGRVVRCLAAVPKGHQIAIAFCDIDDEQQKQLTRRVFKKQMQSHRRKQGLE
ncbi:PilZ domain-containing protein [uncultured Pseudoteredinibacter sp.]|uniref:PilZ domain-containing protein n=1 Tax=uncultured Pseudoteredinibacter sp. TaxID=1641701 RepID=UPI00261FB432|nr:PilZ domain-containing protein [uncultured Pseudoteredinibacter sp.]